MCFFVYVSTPVHSNSQEQGVVVEEAVKTDTESLFFYCTAWNYCNYDHLFSASNSQDFGAIFKNLVMINTFSNLIKHYRSHLGKQYEFHW